MTAIRIQRKRCKGWKLPENTVCVSRGTKWGNPFKIESYLLSPPEDEYDTPLHVSRERFRRYAVMDFESLLHQGLLKFTIDDVKRELRGKNLACWCRLDQPCHADVLLELANQTEPT